MNTTVPDRFESFMKDLNEEIYAREADFWKRKERRDKKRKSKNTMPIGIIHSK